MPKVENRIYEVCEDLTGFCYDYTECTRVGLFGRCREVKMSRDKILFTDKDKIKERKDMGFVFRVKEKVLPFNEPVTH